MLFDYPTLERLAGFVVHDLLRLESGPAAPPVPASGGESPDDQAGREQTLDEVEAMSEADMDAFVLQQLNRLQPGAEASTQFARAGTPHDNRGP